MQNKVGASTISPEKCRCCLTEGYHEYLYDGEIIKKCLNLFLAEEPRLPSAMCAACMGFVRDINRFRAMVVASHQQLLQSLGLQSQTEVYLQNDVDLDHGKVKTELDPDDEIDTSVLLDNAEYNNADCKENPDLKEEPLTHFHIYPDKELSEDFEPNIKVEFDDSIAKVKRKRKNKESTRNKHSRKKRRKYDSESDTPIALIKERKNKLYEETNQSKCISTESRKLVFVDNNKIRSNIMLILKHSTVLPFRNNFKSTFKCFYCDKLYIPFKELKQHIETEHDNVSEATIAKAVRSIQNLIITAHIGCIKCKICEEEFKSIENLVEHLCDAHKKIYHETDKKPSHGILGVDLSSDTLKCHLCDKEFAFFKNLSVHMNEHYGSFVCYVCGKKFLSEHRYRCHEFKAHARKETKCKHCGLVFKTEPAMTYHIRKEHSKGLLKCLKCPATFPNGQYVKRLNHMAEVHGIEKPKFKCDTCNREYANSGSLAAHNRYTHKRIHELRCDICGYITVHKTVMKKHMDFHNGVKNYECEFCKKKFGKPYTLKLHLKIHLNDKRFACTLCDAAFIQKNSLKSHLKSRHPDSAASVNKLAS